MRRRKKERALVATAVLAIGVLFAVCLAVLER
jgi:hypothetical protein